MQVLPSTARPVLLIVLPIAAIFAARMATYSDLATSYPRAAAVLFLWVAADSLTLAMMANTPAKLPELRRVLGGISAGFIVATIGMAEPVRSALFSMPAVVMAMGLTLLLFGIWSAVQMIGAYRHTRSLDRALGVILAPSLIKFARFETGMMKLAFFGWWGKPDVPNDWRAFAGHRIENQMIAALLGLQAIEIGVVHVLVAHFSTYAAYVLLAMGCWGVIISLGLMNGLRLRPVLLSDDCLRVRGGLFLDVAVPLANIERACLSVSGGNVKGRHVLNTTFLASPNVILKLSEPMERHDMTGRQRMIDYIAFRLDDPSMFLRNFAQPG